MRHLLVLAALLLSGCSSVDEPTLAEEPCVVTAADDLSCAEADAEKRPDEVAHVHDYWSGQTSMTLMEATANFGRPHYGSCGAYPVLSILPPEESTVLQGTGRLEITATFERSPEHRAGELELWVRQADQDAPEYVADIDGNMIEMLINASAADLPHQTLSAWEFWVYANPDPELRPAACRIMPRGSIELSVDLFKTLEIEPFPGHPDHWANNTELPLLDAYADVARYSRVVGYCDSGSGSSHPQGACQMWWRGFGPLDGLIVPPGARIITLTLTLDPDVTHTDSELGLRYHGADSRTFLGVPAKSASGNVIEYEIDVEDRHDGPYAQQSQWEFRVVTESDDGTYAGGWSLAATVSR